MIGFDKGRVLPTSHVNVLMPPVKPPRSKTGNQNMPNDQYVDDPPVRAMRG